MPKTPKKVSPAKTKTAKRTTADGSDLGLGVYGLAKSMEGVGEELREELGHLIQSGQDVRQSRRSGFRPAWCIGCLSALRSRNARNPRGPRKSRAIPEALVPKVRALGHLPAKTPLPTRWLVL